MVYSFLIKVYALYENMIANQELACILTTRASEVHAQNEEKFVKITKILGKLFIFTGIFAFLGALYRWGDGSIFSAHNDPNLDIYIAEILVTAPFSIWAGIGIMKQKRCGVFIGAFAAGIYIYGSVLVYAEVFLARRPIPLKLVIPPIYGIALAVIAFCWVWKYNEKFH